MEADLTPNPVADAEAALPAPSEESASPAPGPSQEDAFMNAIIRGETAQLVSTSNPDDDGDDALDVQAADGEPAPPGDAKPTGQQPGRRSRRAEEAAQRLSALEAENARLQAQLTELAPPPPDATEAWRAQVVKDEQRFRRLLLKPDTDTDWVQDDYDWLQTEKQRRALVPELQQHYDTIIEADRRALRESATAEREAFWSRVAADMATAADLPGVDLAALKQAPDFATRDRLVYAAAAATRDAENRALREENAQLRRDLLGTVRPPLNGGRSAPGRVYDEDALMNHLMRQGLRG